MKHIKLLFTFFAFPILMMAQTKKVQFKPSDLKKLAGKWKGTIVSTKNYNDTSTVTLPVSYEMIDDNDSLRIISIGSMADKIIEDRYGFYVNADVNELTFANRLHDITQILHIANRTVIKTVEADEMAKDFDEYAEIRRVITFAEKHFTVVKEVKYFGKDRFVVTQRIVLTRE